MKKLDVTKIQTLIDLAVEEDFGKGDPTSQLTIAEDACTKTYVVTRQDVVVCGMEVVGEVLRRYDERLKLEVLIADGERAVVGGRLAVIEGPLRQMLSAERVVLNFLQRLCGISTMTSKFAGAVEGTAAKIYDTRKTTPGWRELEKYAVSCGGGNNHRMHLGDGVMIKDNHVAEMGDELESKLATMVEEAKAFKDVEFISVEVDHIEGQLDRVLKVGGIDVILLDNMTLDQMKQAVQMRNETCGGTPLLEATGNVNLTTIKEIANTGVDRISIGAITHSAIAVDIGLDT
jgi:nicotinate-nucleotide pyrophosphorylase (carboxylating)